MNKTEEYKNSLNGRDYKLVERCREILLSNIFEDGDLPVKYRFIAPDIGYFHGVWNWDSAFHAIGILRWDPELAKEQVEGFLDFIKPDGMLPDCMNAEGVLKWHSSKPPLFAWAAAKIVRETKDTAFAQRIYDKLVLNEAFWRRERSDGKLFFYGAYNKDDERGTDLLARWESGWDNSVRWDAGIEKLYPVDLNCFMYMCYDSLAYLADCCGKDGSEWKMRKEKLGRLIENTFWNEELGAYTDVFRETGKKSDILSPASFMPLYIKTASKERAEKMKDIAEDEKKFNKTMPTVSFDNPCYAAKNYWRGALWMNVAYFAAKGLKNYGFKVADEIKENILNMVAENEDGIYENYDCVKNVGLCCKHFSWSCVFVTEFILNF